MRVIAACAVATALFALPALGADSEHKQGSQQSKFAACAHESKGLRGDDHQKFMSDCLKGHSDRKEPAHRAAAAEPGQGNRMRGCNEEAARKDLHGDQRRAFMSSCLKG